MDVSYEHNGSNMKNKKYDYLDRTNCNSIVIIQQKGIKELLDEVRKIIKERAVSIVGVPLAHVGDLLEAIDRLEKQHDKDLNKVISY